MAISDQTNYSVRRRQKRGVSHLASVIAFIAIASWSQQSHASNLWLWGWLGVADIQIMQDASNPSGKDRANLTSAPSAKTATPTTAKFPASETAKKSANLTKVQSVDDSRNKDCKDRPFKIIIM
jgi:hypothetical protein